MQFDAFLSHAWVKDKLGRDTHKRVLEISRGLSGKGLKCWIDEVQMEGNIIDRMCSGIDDSSVVVVFVTEDYMTKVRGMGPNGDADNCKREFNYATQQRKLMVAVVLEPSCRDTKTWKGPVAMMLGNHLYIDISGDVTATTVTQLREAIVKAIQPTTPTVFSSIATPVVPTPVPVKTKTRGRLIIPHHGGQYEGEIMNGKANGKGIVTWESGPFAGTLEATFKDNMAHGSGKQSMVNGDSYTGEFVNDQASGHGVFRYANGAVYIGQFKADVKCGHGKLTKPDGWMYEGNWKDDCQHGYGKEVANDGTTYEGEFFNDVAHGRGVLKNRYGSILQSGVWQNNVFFG